MWSLSFARSPTWFAKLVRREWLPAPPSVNRAKLPPPLSLQRSTPSCFRNDASYCFFRPCRVSMAKIWIKDSLRRSRWNIVITQLFSKHETMVTIFKKQNWAHSCKIPSCNLYIMNRRGPKNPFILFEIRYENLFFFHYGNSRHENWFAM